MFKNSAPFVSTCKALMAKLVRHLTSNEEIVGSNPAESNYNIYISFALMAKLVRHLTSNEEIVGSNPAESMCLYVLLFFASETKRCKCCLGCD